MGSGKSTAGKGIAALLRWRFTDLDKLVEQNEGMTVPEIFTVKGEELFRKAETEALQSMSCRTRTVVACGGGTPCSEVNMALMKSTGVTVYLRLPLEALVSRLSSSRTHRPLLDNAGPEDLADRVNELMEKREVWYEQADLVLDTENLDEEEMTTMIAGAVRSKGAYL